MSEYERLREALAKIAEVANAAVNENDFSDYDDNRDDGASDESSNRGRDACALRYLPKRLLVTAAKTAMEINPVNAPVFGPLASVASDLVLDPQRIAVLTAKYWGPTPRRLSVSFMETTSSDLRSRIISHMNAWTKTGSIEFVETQGSGDVRISRGPGGYWSYLGTDILHIPRDRPTMNLQGFTINTPESEYRRVTRHETGHTLGIPHEHMRRELVALIDPEKAYEYFRRTQGWDRATVDQQVLTTLDERSILGTPADATSIMCYQLPGSITRDGRPIPGGTDINQTDFEFVGRIYPKAGHEHFAPDEEWDAEYAAA